MIVIADSGSTKCDWVLMTQTEDMQTKTQGFNPMFHSEDFMVEKLLNNPVLLEHATDVKQVFYYGAGCHGETLNAIIKRALERVFPGAQLNVDHDIKAAVLATCQDQPGISCILGTGSNSAYFDGEGIHQKVSGLGYILGDEGSGAYFGKQLLSNYLYGLLPKPLEEALFNDGHTKSSIIENVYMKPHANVYLASFMRFVSKNQEVPAIRKIIFKGLAAFMERHVCSYPVHKSVPVHFVGSVAHYNQELLNEVCHKFNVRLGSIVQKPITALKKLHSPVNQASIK